MWKPLYLLLLGAIVLLSVTSVQAQIAPSPGTHSAVVTVTDSNVDRIAYLEGRMASYETTLQGCQSSDCCTSCCRSTCCECPGIIAGFDAILYAPHFSNAISYQYREIVSPTTVVTSYGYPTDYEFAPRFWLGYQGPSMGVRARYMQYDEELMAGTMTAADATITLFFDSLSATNGQTLAFETSMLLHVLDLDITKDFEVSCAQLTAGAGLRYGKLRYDYAGTVSSDTVLQFTSSGCNSFEGVGPTAFVDFKAPVHRSCLSVVGGLRGSILFGTGDDVEDVQRVIAPVAQSVTIENSDRSTGVLDASIGLQYDRDLGGDVDAFVRCAWEGQLWMDVGSPVQSSGDMALEGFSACFGVTR
jgi:hypothetical protein